MAHQPGESAASLNIKTWNLIASDAAMALGLADAAYREAVLADDRAGMGEAVFNRGWALVYLGRDREAVHEFSHGLVFFAESDPVMAGRFLNGLVTAFTNLSIFDEALDALGRLYEASEKTGNRPAALVALLNTGWLNIELGNFAEAYRHLKQVEELVDQGEPLSDPGNLYEALGICCVHLNRFEEAEDCFSAAGEFEAVSNDELHWISAALARSVMLEKTGQGAAAYSLAGQALDRARRTGSQLHAAKAILRQAEIRLAFGPAAEARDLVDALLQQDDSQVPPTERVRALELRAAVAELNGEAESALRDLKQARVQESRLSQDRAAIKLELLNGRLALEKERRDHEAARSRNQDLESLNRHLAWMNRLGSIVNASLDWRLIAIELVDELRRHLPVDSFGIARCLPDQAGIDYYLFVEDHRITDRPENGRKALDRLVCRCTRERRPLQSEDSASAALAVPMVLFDQVIGVILARSRRPAGLEPAHLSTLEAIAPVVAASFKNAESYAALTKAKNEISHIANHDALTGLYNRRFLFDFFDSWRSGVLRGGQLACLFYLDLDAFKPINDRFGHLVGDQVLQAVAARFTAQFRESDVCARIGGDEFVVLSAVSAPESADTLRRKLREVLAEPIRIGGESIRAGASIGLAIDPDGQASLEDLLHRADLEMLSFKRQRGRPVTASR
jgi:diguanylate cyclase (GGDEF)-like protein